MHIFGRRKRGRPASPKRISFDYTPKEFYVRDASESVVITFSELEAMRLVDLLGLSLSAAAGRMGVSHSTVWRLVKRARRKVSDALVNGKRIVIVEG